MKYLNIFEQWLLKRIFKKVVTQGDHKERIEEFLTHFYLEFREEFSQDNSPTQEYFLNVSHVEALKKSERWYFKEAQDEASS